MTVSTWQKRKAEGVCTICGGKKDRSDRVMCAPCRTIDLEKGRQKKAKWRETGKCPNCGNPRENRRYIMCQWCRDLVAERRRKNA